MEYWKNGIMFSAIQYKPKIPIFQYAIILRFRRVDEANLDPYPRILIDFLRIYVLTRSTYSPVRVSIRIISPS
jgi:hypothetical protein